MFKLIKCLSHVAVCVSDIERSLEFYAELLGMKVTMDLDIADDRIGRVIGLPGARCRIVHLKLGETVLELFHYAFPLGENIADHMRQCDHGFTHIGFEVDDFHEQLERLKKAKVNFLGEPVEFRPGVWVVYFQGPDGEVCEFRQQPE